jgi:hypothetical protein
MDRSHERDGSCCNFADPRRARVRAGSKSECAEVNKGDAQKVVTIISGDKAKNTNLL